MRRLTKEPIVLDDVLNSCVFSLIAAVAVAVTAIGLHPNLRVEAGAARNLVGLSTLAVTAMKGVRQPLDAAANASHPVGQLPTVVVTGRRLQSAEVVSLTAAN
jgi:hypothetical protein